MSISGSVMRMSVTTRLAPLTRDAVLAILESVKDPEIPVISVVELGMNHPGEIATLARMAQPTVALVNNAQREHQEFMATVEAVARENAAAT